MSPAPEQLLAFFLRCRELTERYNRPIEVIVIDSDDSICITAGYSQRQTGPKDTVYIEITPQGQVTLYGTREDD
ncbi:DUF6888 family protein [Gloeobacter morelensis]|uniref:DUF6888 domain-containing protein n=1 Tax=Gloeobacter morelensis MG652769 TaxID=2781736 RepID=A0ABY3PJ86_9CYAN|nr:hypothetical protein [Gloeobacter morelensis]UFP93711.1 hypothetical protein ISF26_18285 [Gloeobacter morelensis MG652769]